MEQEEEEASSTILSPYTTVSNQVQNQLIIFETEPREEFRGRLVSEYTPKKKNRRDGTQAPTKKAPNYFPDRYNQHYLNLLVYYCNKSISN